MPQPIKPGLSADYRRRLIAQGMSVVEDPNASTKDKLAAMRLVLRFIRKRKRLTQPPTPRTPKTIDELVRGL